jgi:formylglycine-generating enzyme required for sulfatase activity
VKSRVFCRIASAVLVALACSATARGQSCAADLNGDGQVSGTDLSVILAGWGPCGSGADCNGDINGDGSVNGPDLTALLAGWGPCVNVPGWATLLEPLPDPKVVTDPMLRSAITATGYAWRVRDTATQIEMVLIPPGTFQMGCSPSSQWGCNGDESPVHTVTLTNAFYMGRFEVTQAQWTATMGSNPSFFQSPSAQVSVEQVPNRPVERVSWNTVQEFLGATGMRLPTEAEWEYAYRAGTTTAFHSMPGCPNGTNDDGQLGTIAWFSGNALSQTRPVGQKAANDFGLHDMSGNVWEWVNDWYSGTYYASSPSVNPPGPSSGSYRVLRGGTWASLSNHCRSSRRFDGDPSDGYGSIDGFRVARAPADTPTLTLVSPPSGPTTGGTTITLTGTNLTGATSVAVGGSAATNVQVVNSTTVTAVTPVGTAGPRDVTVMTPGGTATRTGGFVYGVPSWATLVETAPDPAIVTDAALRAAIAAAGYAWRVRDNATQIEMVLIPPGSFEMGCSPSKWWGCTSAESPVHTVTLTQPFYMGRYEVTQAQWTAQMESNPSNFQSASAQVPAEQVPNRPVEQVSWDMIQGFLSATDMRLPTEAEWEYAYRAGTTTAFHSMPGYPNGTNDDNQLGTIAWFSSNSESQTRPVGQKAGNGFGLHDMGGNVWEWVNDWGSESYYASSPSVNPPGPSSGTFRVLRGGSWVLNSYYCRSSLRFGLNPSVDNSDLGFRVAREP